MAETQYEQTGNGKEYPDLPDDNQCKGCVSSKKRKYAEKCTGDSKVAGCPQKK